MVCVRVYSVQLFHFEQINKCFLNVEIYQDLTTFVIAYGKI